MADVAIARKRQAMAANKESNEEARSALGPCLVCNNDDERVQMCSLCLTSMHGSCCNRLLEWARAVGASARWRDAQRTILLKLFANVVCAACLV